MGAEMNIPDEIKDLAFEAYIDGPGATIGQGVEAALAAAAPLIVAAEIANDVGLEVLRDMASRVGSDSDAMVLVGAVLRYVDDRRRRASELRGEV